MKAKSLYVALLFFVSAAQAAGGYFGLSQTAKDHWTLLDPQGQPFFSKAVCAVNPSDGAIKPGAEGYNVLPKYKSDKNEWAKASWKRLQTWGFNSLGCWSDEAFYRLDVPFVHTLALAGYGNPDRLVDVFSDSFAKAIQEKAAQGTAKLKDNTQLIGYFLDNELPWYGDFGWPGDPSHSLFDKYMALEGDRPGKAKALETLKRVWSLKDLANATGQIFQNWAEVQQAKFPLGDVAWPKTARAQFIGMVAEQYFKVACQAVRTQDPHHLILGCRFAGPQPDGVAQAAGHTCDVVSLNSYPKSGNFDVALFDSVYRASGRPLLLTEFSYRAMQNNSGDPNTRGADVTVQTQAERAEHTKRFLRQGLQLPYLLGYHWFEYADESPQGRSFDGEDSNYGLVDIRDHEYPELIEALKEVNAVAEAAHANASHGVPAQIPQAPSIRLRDKAIAGLQPDSAPRKNYVDFTRDSVEGVATVWNEASARSSLKAAKEDYAGKSLKCVQDEFDSGSNWGQGLSLRAASGTNADHSANYLGYHALEILAKAPRGLRFQVQVVESGAAEPSAASYQAVAESDGESYACDVLKGSGQWQLYRIDLADMDLQTGWGNQHGNRVIDLQAVWNVGLFWSGKQGKGVFEVARVDFVK